MPSRRHGTLHEGMTRGATRPRGGRVALAALMAALLVLALGWAAVSTLGGDREARAQSSGGGSDELAQAEPAPEDEAQDDSGGQSEPSYEAFGEPRNPFALVVEPAEEGGTTETEDGAAQEAAADGGNDNTSSSTTAEDTTGSPDNNGPGGNGAEREPFGSTAPGGQTPNSPGRGVITGPNGERVDCGDPADEFEQLLCEDRRGGFSSANGEAGAGSGGGQGPPGSGGSGRSGAGEPAEQFRNGGGGFVK